MKKVIGLALCGAFFVSAAMADTLTDRLDKALLEVTATKNAAARAEYAIKRAKEAVVVTQTPVDDHQPSLPTVGETQNAPTDPAPIEPAPAPAPVPVEPPPPLPSPVALDGEADAITTASGTWRVTRLAAQGDIVAYRWTLDGKPEWRRLVVARQLSAVALTTLDEQPITVDGIALTVAPGAVRVWQSGAPVAWRWDWLKQAVADGRTPGIAAPPASMAKYYRAFAAPVLPAYDPTTISPAKVGTIATSSSNSVGVTSGQGGEYDSSRGFYHNADATAVQQAQAGAGTAALADLLQRLTIDQLSHPQAAQWSQDGLADPQFPYPGDSVVGPRVSIPNWGRDTQHLENACWAHWIATADPIAGLCLQRQTAFMLQQHLVGWRSKDGRYSYGQGIERVNWNALVTVWKSRDVARRVTGRTLYDRARAEKMFADVVQWTDEKVAAPIYNQPVPTVTVSGNIADLAPVARYSAKLAGAIMHTPAQAPSARDEPDGSKSYFMVAPDFMTGQYGGVILPLLVKDGNATAKVWAGHIARHLSIRLALGYRGVEGTEETRGSAVATGPAIYETRASPWGPKAQAWPVMPQADYSAYLASFNRGPTDSFNGSGAHTVIQMRNMLASLKAQGVQIDDAALAKADALIAATADWKHQLRAKHLGVVN